MAEQVTTKPFASRAQQRMAFARRMPWAKRWAKQTNFATLPERKAAPVCTCKASQQLAPGVSRIHGDLCNVHGRYGSCAAAGFGAAPGASKRVAPKKLPNAPKPKAGGKKAGGGGKKGAAPRKTEAQRETERQAKRAQAAAQKKTQEEQNRKDVLSKLGIDANGQAALAALREGNQADPAAIERAGLVKAGLVEQAADGSYRMTASGRSVLEAADQGDAGRAGATISAARDRTTARTTRQAAAAERKRQADAKRAAAEAARKKRQAQAQQRKRASTSTQQPKPPVKAPARSGGGGGGGGAPKPVATGGGGGGRARQQPQIPQALQDAVGALSDGQELDEQTIAALVRNGLVRLNRDGTPSLTGQGLRILAQRGKAMETTKATWDTSYVNNLPDSSFLFVESGGTKDADGKTVPRSKRHFPYKDANGGIDLPHLRNAIARIPQSNAPGLNKDAVQKRAQAMLEKANTKSFAVFKDASGAYRWIAKTTTAFLDREQEIISTKSLEDDVARADADGKYGPLRWWHLGRPNPLDPVAPWGPGVDLGTCDFNAMSGKTLIESGTFKSDAIAQAVAAHADQLELSPGFFHAPGEPDASGVFNHIRRFERSLVPNWAGRAANPYTGLVVEKSMDQTKIDALKTLGVDEATIKSLLADVEKTEKSAEAEGVRYKESRPWHDALIAFLKGETPAITTKTEPPPEPEAAPAPPADPIAALTAQVAALSAELTALKAGPMDMGGGAMMTDAEDNPAQGGDSGVDETAEGDAGGLTLSPDDLAAIGQVIGTVLQAALEPLIGAMSMTQKLEAGLGELKTLMGGYTKTKDDAEAARENEIAALKASIDQQQAQLAELVGDAPRAGYRPSQAADNVPWHDPQVLAAMKDGPGGASTGFDDLATRIFPGLAPPR